jgi:hypothetical protein
MGWQDISILSMKDVMLELDIKTCLITKLLLNVFYDIEGLLLYFLHGYYIAKTSLKMSNRKYSFYIPIDE